MTDVYEEIVRCRREGEQAALVTVINTGGSVPREIGAKMLVFPITYLQQRFSIKS